MIDLRLEQQLKRLMLLRVVMITTLLLVAVYVETVSETLRRVNPLYFLIIATYVLTLVYVVAVRLRWPPITGQVYTQLVFDLLLVTGLVYLTGGSGARAGFMLLYPMAVLAGGVLLHRGRGVMLAGVATLLYAALLWAVRERIIPSYGLEDVPFAPTKHVLYSIFVTGVSCVTVAMIGGYLSHTLTKVGAQLEEVEGQVADLQELNKVIVQSIHSGLLMADTQGRVLYLNRYGESVLSRPTVEIRGRTLREVFGVPAFDLSSVAARAADDRLSRFETAYERKDGTTVDIGISVMPLAAPNPQRGGYLLVFQDLTDVKRLEREVRVNEKLAAVGEMAAQLAHEIRNPLGAISGSAQVLMSEANVTEDQSKLLAIIKRESRRLSDTLNQFLYQARPSQTGLGPVDLGPLLEEAVALLVNGPEVKAHHEVKFERDTGPHVCLVDSDQMLQVFWNLARNALEAMPAGGRLSVRLRRGDDIVVVSVVDQGKGLAAGDAQLMFEPLRSGSRVGAGLGLAIVYRIVRDHHGDISVRSRPTEGTEVEVRLPAVRVSA